MDRKALIAQALQSVKEGNAASYREQEAALKEIREKYWLAMQPAEAVIKATREEFSDKAFELAEAAGKVPFSRSGSTLSPSDVQVVEAGILLSWNNDDYADDTFLATWEMLGMV